MEILLLGLLVLVFLGLPMLQMRKQSKQIGVIKNFQASLAPGMVVQTTSGLHGRITNVGDTTVDLEVAPGTVTTWDRGAVLKLVETVDAGSTEAAHLAGGASSGDYSSDAEVQRIPDDISSLDEVERDSGGDSDASDGDDGRDDDGRDDKGGDARPDRR